MRKRVLSLILVVIMLTILSVGAAAAPLDLLEDDNRTAETESSEETEEEPSIQPDEDIPEDETGENTAEPEEIFGLFEAAATSAGGSFILSAAYNGDMIIHPKLIAYDGEDTVKQALEKSGHVFTGLDSGMVTTIDGIRPNSGFTRYDNIGGFDLDRAASEITAFFFLDASFEAVTPEIAGGIAGMTAVMADFNGAENGVKSYEKAKTAYNNAAQALCIRPSPFEAAAYDLLSETLRNAMREYEESVLAGTKAELILSFGVLPGSGSALTEYTFTATDAYGNSFVFSQGETLMLVPEKYSFILSDNGYNRAEGSMTVSGNGTVTINGTAVNSIDLYTGAWIDSLPLIHSEGVGGNYGIDYPGGEYSANHKTVYYVPDNMSGTYLYIEPGSGIDGTVYTTGNVTIHAVFVNTSGVRVDSARVWSSKTTALINLIKKGAAGNTAVFEARHSYGGYTVIQSYTAIIERTPTLSKLDITADGTELNIGFDADITEYTCSVTSDSVTVTPKTFGAYEDGYSVTLNGNPVSEGESITVPLDGGETEVIAGVSLGAHTQTYRLNITKVGSVPVYISCGDSGVTVTVKNTAGAEIGYSDYSDNKYTFNLIPDETYAYTATKDTYYHSAETFTAQSGKSLTASVDTESGDWLSWLWLADGASRTSSHYYLGGAETYRPAETAFESQAHEYEITVPDNVSQSIYAWGLESDFTITAVEPGVVISRNKDTTGQQLGSVSKPMFNVGDNGANLTIRISKLAGTVTHYQDYHIKIKRLLTVNNMTVEALGAAQHLYQVKDGEATAITGYSPDVTDYQITIPRGAQNAALTITPYVKHYYAVTGDSEYNSDENGVITVPVTLDTSLDKESITIQIKSGSSDTVCPEYTVQFEKRAALPVNIDIRDESGETIAGAMAAVYHDTTKDRVWPEENGTFMLVDQTKYYYVATCYGYIGQTDVFTASESMKNIVLTFEDAPESVHGAGTSSYWPYFRGDSDANGIVDSNIPVAPESAALSWAVKIGEGYGSGATGCPILISEDGIDYIVTYAGNTIVKAETVTGKIVARGTMVRASSFAINSPTYAEGMIFVALSDGRVQAFDAVTLQSLWIYKDPLGGQPNCPITYRDGYIYTGFWNGEEVNANLICLSITDENPASSDEAKLARWTYTSKGGFYWAGSYIGDGFMLVGTDDGKDGYLSDTAALLCLDPDTGKLLDKIGGLRGDIRSNVSYSDGRYFFTSKGGYFYSAELIYDAGKFAGLNKETFRQIYLDNYTNNPSNPPMSTSTPVVYNGRAYIGVSGTSQFGAYTGHNITVIDLDNWKIAYAVRTQGYPQTSGLLTTAYEETEGYVYIYFFDNYTPGKLRVLKDKPGVNAPLLIDVEEYTDKGQTTEYNTAKVIFTPSGEQAQYSICSPIADAYGNIYFKNDSAYMMSLSGEVDSIEITKLPDKTEYRVGESFNPEGMEITITYKTGAVRTLPWGQTIGDVELDYFTWAEKPLTLSDNILTIVFPHVMYKNADGKAGIPVSPPTAALSLTVTEGSALLGDVDGDTIIGPSDASLILRHVVNLETLSETQLDVANVDGDAIVGPSDASLILRYVVNLIDEFPAANK